MRGVTGTEYDILRALLTVRGEYVFHMPSVNSLVCSKRLRRIGDQFVVTDLGKLAVQFWPATRSAR